MATPLTTNCSTGPFPGVSRDDKRRRASHGASPDRNRYFLRPRRRSAKPITFPQAGEWLVWGKVASRYDAAPAMNRSDITGMCTPLEEVEPTPAALKRWGSRLVWSKARCTAATLVLTQNSIV